MHTVEMGKRIAIKNVLFATDFSPASNSALPYALSMVRRYEANLFVVHVRPTDAEIFFASPESWPAIADEENSWLQARVNEVEKQVKETPHTVLTPQGNVEDALADVIRERDIDLLVLGSRGRTGVGKLLLGSVAEEIFRHTVCPVLSIGPNISQKPDREMQFRRILFATEFSKDSLTALRYAVSLAEEDEAQLTLLHVVEQPAVGIADTEEIKTSLLTRLQSLVPPESALWCSPECLIEFGRNFATPSEPILEVAAKQGADLIVLGARPIHGKMGLGTHLSSTTTEILTHASCPVLTVCAG